ncbi:MAG: hypothetical protein ROZ00_04845 [Denitratisoma sp.]|nr:hypothetical protein [Denitratisoma sp.]
MRERPILFSAPMVRAILDDTKTKTRRVIKPQPVSTRGSKKPWCSIEDLLKACPYGQPGDRLWVRENGWERPERTPRMMREGADTWEPYYYDADRWFDEDHADFKRWGFKRRPSIHMPRWASRIDLEIVAVRVERLQDISVADAIAEGLYQETMPGTAAALWRYAPGSDWYSHPVQCYRALWEHINGPGSWAANPWVWAVEFRRVK